MIKSVKYRIYPNKEQEEFLTKSFGCSRFIYNWALAKKNQDYKETKKSASLFDLIKMLPKLKKEYPWLKEVDSQSLQVSLRNLDNAFTQFFKKKFNYPQFKKKSNHRYSFQLTQNVKIKNGKLKIPKMTSGIKIKLHRKIDGIVKTVTISKNPSCQYFASFMIDDNIDYLPLEPYSYDTSIGIDLGIKDFAVLSNGERITNPKYLKQSLKKLKDKQRRLSKKQKGSFNRNKARVKLARLYQKVTNQRDDFQHKLTYRLTHENQVSTLVIEDLAVCNMVKNHKLAQAISDAGWGEFRRQLDYKCRWYGKNLIVINRFFPSSKLCGDCGAINDALTLNDRIWECSCGKTHDRDLNAATNIKNLGNEIYRRNYGNSSLWRAEVTQLCEVGNLSLAG